MKALFEEDKKELIIGREGNKLTLKLVVYSEGMSESRKTEISFSYEESLKIESFIGKMNNEIEENQTTSKSFWSNIF